MKNLLLFIVCVFFVTHHIFAQPGQYQAKKYMDKESLAKNEWKECDFLLYFYCTDKGFEVTILKRDTSTSTPNIVAEIYVKKRPKVKTVNRTWVYTYKGSEGQNNFEIKSSECELKDFCDNKVDESPIAISAEINGIPFYQVFWCEKVNLVEEFHTFDEL